MFEFVDLSTINLYKVLILLFELILVQIHRIHIDSDKKRENKEYKPKFRGYKSRGLVQKIGPQKYGFGSNPN
jgi:hypothetical protein